MGDNEGGKLIPEGGGGGNQSSAKASLPLSEISLECQE